MNLRPKSLIAAFGILITAAALAQDAQPARPAPDGAAVSKSDAKKPVYDEHADAKTQIAAALARAGKENRRVLIQWGGNWCPWCIKLHALFGENREIARELEYEYEIVYVDSGKPQGKNVDLASTYGANLAKHGYPFLTILDADGKALANQESSPLEVDGKRVEAGHDPAKVLALLKKHEAAPRDATKTLDAALARAKTEQKTAFVHFGAPWCGWCRKLEAWLERDEVSAILAKDFVEVKIDIDRMTGGKDVLSKYAGTDKIGIPWTVFLDPGGKALADSNEKPGDSNSNIGFPAQDNEIAHFLKMIKQVATRISADDCEKLRKSLRASDTPGRAVSRP
ncbi:MAG: thioredoxin family protein [Phycisphaerae bacterium]